MTNGRNELQAQVEELLASEPSHQVLREELADLFQHHGSLSNDHAAAKLKDTLRNVAPGDYHVGWFAAGIAWARNSEESTDSIDTAVKAMKSGTSAALNKALTYALPGREDELRQALSAGSLLLTLVGHPPKLDTLNTLSGYQQRMIQVLREHESIRGIGAWNLGAMFLVGIVTQPILRESMQSASPMLPMSKPVFESLEKLFELGVTPRRPLKAPWDREVYDVENLTHNNSILESLGSYLFMDNLVDLHAALFKWSTKNKESYLWS